MKRPSLYELSKMNPPKGQFGGVMAGIPSRHIHEKMALLKAAQLMQSSEDVRGIISEQAENSGEGSESKKSK